MENFQVSALLAFNDKLYAGTLGAGVYISGNEGQSWQQSSKGIYPSGISFIKTFGDLIFAGLDSGHGLFFSSNAGDTWSRRNSNLFSTFVNDLISKDSYLYLATSDGVSVSSNNGLNWENLEGGIEFKDVRALCAHNNSIFAATFGDGIFRTTDNGVSWQAVNTGLNSNDVRALLSLGADLFAGTDHGIYKSNDNGNTWVYISNDMPPSYVLSLVNIGSDIYAANFGDGVYKSTNGGTTWSRINSNIGTPFVEVLYTANSLLFAGTFGSGIFYSNNGGASWIEYNDGLTDGHIFAINSVGNYLFTGSSGMGIMKRDISDLVTSIDDRDNANINGFELEQNYPNPFNPSTTISFTLPQASEVNLSIHDASGSLITTLVSGYLAEGKHTLHFNASADGLSLASGVYFYKLSAKDFISVKKLILLK
ncbi:MAG: T9SS type A sorting domain-containing protein [Ignavibacteriaceae bacterium]|nr:T9SS type A sorting domain-containing protein [Ignavibacteriaceae bacterium]